MHGWRGMRMLKTWCLAAILLTGLAASVNGLAQTPTGAPIVVKVVVLTSFEIGADSGDAPGEFQFWHDRLKLATRFAFAHHHDLYMNLHTGGLGMLTGGG